MRLCTSGDRHPSLEGLRSSHRWLNSAMFHGFPKNLSWNRLGRFPSQAIHTPRNVSKYENTLFVSDENIR